MRKKFRPFAKPRRASWHERQAHWHYLGNGGYMKPRFAGVNSDTNYSDQ